MNSLWFNYNDCEQKYYLVFPSFLLQFLQIVASFNKNMSVSNKCKWWTKHTATEQKFICLNIKMTALENHLKIVKYVKKDSFIQTQLVILDYIR